MRSFGRFALLPALVLLICALFASSAQADFNTLAFSDEFNGNTSDIATKWKVDQFCNFNGQPTYGGPSQSCFEPDHATEGYGVLVLAATYQPACGDGTFTCWLAAQLESKQTVTPPFKVQVRARTAPGVGMWSAPAWLSNACMEVDVAEQLGFEPTGTTESVHRWGCTGSHVSKTDFADTPNVLSDNWTTYRADVFSDHVDFYVNGTLKNTITDDEVGGAGSWRMLSPATLKTTLDVGTCGSWAGCPTYTDPRYELVDWLRVYTP